jgi:hypothetical protein
MAKKLKVEELKKPMSSKKKPQGTILQIPPKQLQEKQRNKYMRKKFELVH